MIDFHNHILPGVDDGSESIKMSLSMLKKAAKQGIVGELIKRVKNVNYDYLLEEVNKLQRILDREKINIKIHLSSEVFYLPNLYEISKNPLNTIGKGKYMLIEFTPGIFPTGYEEEFYNLQLKGITPIVAHPERYRFIQKEIDVFNGWIDKGYIIQVDAGSIRGHFGEKIKNFSIEMIKKGYVHLIGSDAHDNKGRNFCLKKTYDFIEKNISSNSVDVFKCNAEKLLRGEDLDSIEIFSSSDSFIDKIRKRFKFL